MTITTNAPTEQTAELVRLDPSAYKLEPNVRSLPQVDDEFVNSIRDHGVIVPVLAYRDGDTIYIRDGQRRYLGAIEAGKTLPAHVLPKSTLDGKAEDIQRIIEQLITNKHRENVTTADTVTAVQQLALDGLSVTKIAGSSLGLDKNRVKAALTVAKSPAAMELAAQGEIDLLQLATISEYEEYPELVEQLLEVAIEDPEQFDHAASEAAQEKRRLEVIETRIKELESEGITTYRVGQLNSGEVKRLSNYEKDDDATIDPAAAGVGTVVHAAWDGRLTEIPVAVDPIAAGYKVRSYSSESRSQTGPMTDEQKAERRKIVRSNKAWDATIPVRADWLENFLKRKQFPKDSAVFLSIIHTRFPYDLSRENDSMAHDLLGITAKHGINVNALAELVEANPAKAGVVMLALTLGKLEGGTSRETWRHPTAANRAYLLQLREWGYTLSTVELVAIGEATEVPENPTGVVDIEEDLEDVDVDDNEDDGGDAA